MADRKRKSSLAVPSTSIGSVPRTANVSFSTCVQSISNTPSPGKLTGTTGDPRGRLTFLERQQRFREEREAKKRLLDSRHYYIIELLILVLDISMTDVEDCLLEGDTLDEFDSFFAVNGQKHLLFYYQEMDQDTPTPALEDSRRRSIALSLRSVSRVSTKPRLVLTGGQGVALQGTAVLFLRLDNSMRIEKNNIEKEVLLTLVDGTKGLLPAICELLTEVFTPFLTSMKDEWGEVDNDKKGTLIKNNFLSSFNSVIRSLEVAQDSINNRVELPACPKISTTKLMSIADYEDILKSEESLDIIEACFKTWIKQIKNVIVTSEQFRREDEDVGPQAEMNYWKKRMAQFNSLLTEIKSVKVGNVLKCLQVARSKLLKDWCELDDAVTDGANEAKENVKFLYVLEKYCEPLYSNDPVLMLETLQEMMNTVKMILTFSRYYNTSERLTSLLIKVTNQMVTSCKNYITELGAETVWSQPKHLLFDKIRSCLHLHLSYRDCFRKTLAEIKSGEETAILDLSESYIFGKFDLFAKRLQKILDLFSFIEMYATVEKTRMDGLESMSARYKAIVANVRKKQYNFLDQRKQEFDRDFDDFKCSIDDLQADIVSCLEDALSSLRTSAMSLEFLDRFERLCLPSLSLKSSYYPRILLQFENELNDVNKLYMQNRLKPPLERNLPPTAGRILWARQLHRKIEEPMKRFRDLPELLKNNNARRIVKTFNNVARALVEYQVLYHRAWLREADYVKLCLQCPVLALDEETGKPIVNFDPVISLVIREADCLVKAKLEITEYAKYLRSQKADLCKRYDHLNLLLEERQKVQDNVLPVLECLMAPHLTILDGAMEPGFMSISWNSLNIWKFIEQVKTALKNFERLSVDAKNLYECRIKAVLDNMSSTILCELPSGEPWTIQKLIANTQELCRKGAVSLQIKSQTVNTAVKELIESLLLPDVYTGEFATSASIESEELRKNKEDSNCTRSRTSCLSELMQSVDCGYTIASLREAARDLYQHFSTRNFEAVASAIQAPLDTIRQIFMSKALVSYTRETGTLKGKKIIFRSELLLEIPNISLRPSLDEIQQGLNTACQVIVSVAKNIQKWDTQTYGAKLAKSRWPAAKAVLKKLSDSTDVESSPQVQLSRRSSRQYSRVETHCIGFADIVEASLTGSYYKAIFERKDIEKMLSQLSGCISSLKKEVMTTFKDLEKYHCVWQEDRDIELEQFLLQNPDVIDFSAKIREYKKMESLIQNEPDHIDVAPITLYTENLKLALAAEAKIWQLHYGKACLEKYRGEMNHIFEFIEKGVQKLSRPIKELEDIKFTMEALQTIRENEIEIDMCIGPIEQCFSMLLKYKYSVPREDADKVDTLQYAWKELLRKAYDMQCYLVRIQPEFKRQLMLDVQLFVGDCNTFYSEYKKDGPMAPGLKPYEAADKLVVYQHHFDTLWRKYIMYTTGEKLFGLPVTEQRELERIKKELALLQKLYGLYSDVRKSVHAYHSLQWDEVKIDKIIDELQDLQMRCRKLPKAMKEWQAYIDLKQMIDDFNAMVPLVEMMSNKSMKARHWEQISELTGHTLDVESSSFSLRTVMDAPLLKYKEEIEDVCIAAVKEKDIDTKLKQVIADFTLADLTFATFKNKGEILLKGDNTIEIISQMEDSLMVLASLLSSRYNAPFRNQIQSWTNNLSNGIEVLNTWLTVQNLWVYLEAVFVGGDIAKQLPKEAKRFHSIDKTWLSIMLKAHETVNSVQCCLCDEMLLLPHLLQQLEICQKSLAGYLETKRAVFPRFCFVSDPTLLEILGQASNPQTIQRHLLSVFDNIKTVTFHHKETDKILAISSSEDETVELLKHVRAEGPVELWLMSLLSSARHALHNVIENAATLIGEPNFNLLEFLTNFPAQVGLLGLQMIWTRDSEEALSKARHEKWIMTTTNQRFLFMLNKLIAQTTTDLSKVERTKFETMITIHVHQRDIFDHLCQLNIRSPYDFEWLKQSRFYFLHNEDRTAIAITNVDFTYQNEFLGCTERLVITPLTDRCYITLAQAIGLSMGGAPAGPAGTGKTETVKDMGRCLGKYVVVFNCSDQMDYRGLGRIFKGLAQSGSWGCFDEFNRIELPVLSVAAQQIAVVLACRKERCKEFIFTDEQLVTMNPEFGIFLTMNPGYAGRQELPENLKINFRNVAMMVPDRQIIIRVKLASVGFVENINLARKFYTLYQLCEEQLSKQVHYDFGLRNILSVLRTLGKEKRLNLAESEFSVVMRVLRDMNLSKLVDEDEPLFMSLVDDLFPGITLQKAKYPELDAAICKLIEESGLVNHKPWALKLIQLYETQKVRHGMMVLGPTGAGKTQCIHTLMKAMTACGEAHREFRMNPKAITAAQMFGRLDVATNDWTDGIFSAIWRKTLHLKKDEHVWIVLDGPVDAIWIENLNSVLDDNKTLTLANGDRIPMSPMCKIIFEVHNIDNASPATVSRNGMVFMSSSCLDWKPLLEAWLLTRNQAQVEDIRQLFLQSFESICNFVWQNLQFSMVVLECNIVSQCLTIMEGLLHSVKPPSSSHSSYLSKLYTFSVMWSIGAFLEIEERKKLEVFLRENSKKLQLDLPVSVSKHSCTMYDYYVDETGNWKHWYTKVSDYVYPSDETPEYSTVLVPNVDSVRTDFLLQTVTKQGKAVLLVGEQGTAKTVMIKSFMEEFNQDEHLTKTVSFSSATTPLLFQQTMESYMDKRLGNTYGPPAGKTMTVFIDDISMPLINDWGDQITNEIVRQLIEYKGFYNLEKPGDFMTVADVQFLAAMGQPSHGRNDIPSRLKRHFAVFTCLLPSDHSISKIFSAIANGYFCSQRGFTSEVQNLAVKLVACTTVLWQHTKTKMLPTPSKFHYVFNMRDLSRIWQGMINANSSIITSSALLLALWKHECCRVIADRFITQDDFDWFTQKLSDVVDETLGLDHGEHVEAVTYFCDFIKEPPDVVGEDLIDTDAVTKYYEPVPNFQMLEDRLKMLMAQYNENVRGSGLDLVFFADAMVHIIRITRILQTPQGHVLLVGIGGSGKQSLSKLASFIAGYKLFRITLTRSYNISNLKEDLKQLYRIAGLQGKGVSFVFTEQEIKDENFLEYINSMLSTGWVSSLFAREEMDEVLQELIPIMKKEYPRRPPTPEVLQDYFLSRCRKNLHVVLCFSPVGQKFRDRVLKFPALVSGCTMVWFQKWPKEALRVVADHILASFDIVCSPLTKVQLIEAMADIHDGVAKHCADYFHRYRRLTHVTPKSYLSFIEGYKKVYGTKKNEIDTQANRVSMGLHKLLEASDCITQLSKELSMKEVELKSASQTADQVLKEVTVSAQAAEKVKSQVQVVKDKAQMIVDQIQTDKLTAESKLEAAKPALEQAKEALNTIKPAHIATVRKLAKPPHLIMRIMDCVLILFQKKLQPVVVDTVRQCLRPSWSESLKLMSQSGFLQSLQNFPKDTMNDEMVELLQPYIMTDDYNMENAQRVCGDVAGLCSWTKAMVIFHDINKEVMPLKANLAKQQGKLDTANEDLQAAESQLSEKQCELDAAQSMYDNAVWKKHKLVEDADTCRTKMGTATLLIEGLSDERKRWTEEEKAFKCQVQRLVGDALLATAFLCYSGPFNQTFREELSLSWQSELVQRCIPFDEQLQVTTLLVDKTTITDWNLQGLPSDEVSIQNGVIATRASVYPLLIDPQGQAKNWIKNREANNDLAVTFLNHKYFRQHLEDALSRGKPLLIEDVDENLDPALDNILEKNFVKSGSALKVKVGDKEVDIMPGFSLVLTTKLSNPAFSPEICAKTAIIDFAVSMQGLEDQLLTIVVSTEKKELESERVQLMEDVIKNKNKIQELEDSLLFRLTNTKGSLVDDEGLIDVLRSTKSTALEVKQKLAVAAETEVQIIKSREEYRPVATRGSIVYFLIVDMSMVNVMYQTSLHEFLKLFNESLARAPACRVTPKRVENIVEFLTYHTFKYVVRGFYKQHKFLFALLLALKIDLQSGKITCQEFKVFIRGGAALDLQTVSPKPFKWIPDMSWLNLIHLQTLSSFKDILDQVRDNEKGWKLWFDKEAPENFQIPDGYGQMLNMFRSLLLIRSWCPDRIIAQAKNYVAESLGKKFVEEVLLDLEQIWKESNCATPIIGLLSMGADSTSAIESLAKKLKCEFKAISMGQGQEHHARCLLASCMQSGAWFLLQNCHLGLNYCNELIDSLQNVLSVNPEFRLWITTEVHPQFPITLLQMSVKYTNEPPQGIKAGLMKTYAGISQDQLDAISVPQWKPLLYAIAFFHTIVQERRKFGPLGWNIPYEFNASDYNATVQFVQNYLDDLDVKKDVSWVTVRYMIGEVHYGGRVTDDYDKRVLTTFTSLLFNEKTLMPGFGFHTAYPMVQFPKVEEYINYIQTLSSHDLPEVFCLHSNADIIYQTRLAQMTLDTMLDILPKDSSGIEGETRETVVYRMASDMLQRLPADYVPYEVKSALQKLGALLPLNIFLRQEIDRMQRVITLVRTSLSELKLAIDGTIVMSDVTADVFNCMYDARVSAKWAKVSWMSSTLGFWFSDLLERDAQYRSWCFGGKPSSFWLSGFFNCQGFLTAMRQEITRSHKGWSLDTVLLQNDVTKLFKDDIMASPPEGVYVHGLFLEGAGWDRRGNKLTESKSKVLYEPLPVIHLYAVNEIITKGGKNYLCPLYKKLVRTDRTYVTSVQLKTNQPPEHWIMKGVALLCDVK